MINISRLGRAVVFACAGIVSLPGCGRDGRQPVYPVRGTVVDAQNKPAVGALLIFHPVGDAAMDSTKPLAYVDEDGTFALTTYTKNDGAPLGEYVVTIEWRPRSSNPFDAKKQGRDKLQGRYSNPALSKIRFTVQKNSSNEVPAIRVQ